MPVERPDAREWLRLANGDLRVAELVLRENEPMFEVALFHCQQAAEKALKAAIVEAGELPPKVHDLGILLDRLVALRPEFVKLEVAAKTLSPYAVEPRYPQLSRAYTKEEGDEAIALARLVVSTVHDS